MYPPRGTWNFSIESYPLWRFRYICSFQQSQQSSIALIKASLTGCYR
jgi:hypothetical protein